MSTIDENQPGSSAERQYANRRHARHARIKARYGTVGSIIATVAGEPQHVHAWRYGAEGEAATARALQVRLSRSDVIVLHDRRAGRGGRANIDHIAIAPTGVTIIDSKASRGRVQLTTTGVINRREQLLIAGRDRTSQLDSLVRQIDRVAGVLDRHGFAHVPVFGALCFPFMRRERWHSSRACDGLIIVDDPAHIAKHLKRPGPIALEEIDRVAETLAAAFPPA